jgi:hypothetical protein
MPKDTPLCNVPPIFVTANDGTLFSCIAHRTTAESPTAELGWKLTDPSGVEHFGPPDLGRQSPVELQHLVFQWWDATKAPTQAGADGDGSVERRRSASSARSANFSTG